MRPSVAAAPASSAATLSGGGVAEDRGVWLSWRAHGDGEPVLMIMGFLGSARAWFRLLPHIAASHRAIVFDNRGTGDSDRPRGLWTMDDLARDALAVLDAAGHESAHVVGVSMGGMIAQRVALDYPGRVRSLSLLCTQAAGQGRVPPWRMVANVALYPLLGSERSFALVAPALYASRTRAERADRLEEDLSQRFAEGGALATVVGQYAAIARHDTRARLGELKMPVLVMHGEEDLIVPPRAARELARRIGHAQLVMLPDCGHLLATDAEEPAAAALLDFFERSADTAAAA